MGNGKVGAGQSARVRARAARARVRAAPCARAQQKRAARARARAGGLQKEKVVCSVVSPVRVPGAQKRDTPSDDIMSRHMTDDRPTRPPPTYRWIHNENRDR